MTLAAETVQSYERTALELAERLRSDAIQRDKQGGTPKVQRDWIRESGLLKLLIPREYGGDGQPWSAVLRVVRILAEADASLAHLYGYHFLCLVAPHLAGTPEQIAHFYTVTARNNYFWGNSSNPLVKTIIGRREGDRVIVNGSKTFSSGSPDSDLLAISWNDAETGEYYEGIIPTSRPGVEVLDDWDNMGQRQTGSGTVTFRDVPVEKEEILETPYAGHTVFSTIIPIVSQSILANIFAGSAEGALEDAKRYTHDTSRPWYTSGYARADEDPSIWRQYGELWTSSIAATSLVEKAADKLDRLWERGTDLTEEERGECAVIVAAANVHAGRVALDITSRIFDVMGARATASKYGFDRFWRNVRTHTLHNPAEYKLRNIGAWVLNGTLPEPGYYS
ncbi:acyl-CoA dehydrogenase family protein [Paenibacillus kobensis]|uniref:acyl-CoA dehydrogenase family protein n=1 Tax=Paenibacillus kobensis TaxID=59841 RepID=UPI000FDB5BA2|nr:acyl-CoA dehydrogenase family protein [Paenibacillus kobensis]